MLLHFPFLLAMQDFSQQPPAQELIARDLHDVEWKFRHIFRGKFEPLFSTCSYFSTGGWGGVENLSFDGVLWACNLLNVFFSAKI